MNIRLMDMSDVSPVSHIEQQVTPHPWRESEFLDSYAKHRCLVLDVDNSVIGYAIYQIVAGEAEILNIAIAPACQGKGYGRQLLEYMVELVSKQAERFFLEVRVSNSSAIQLYESVGFVEVCLRRNYYQTADGPEDAILMAMEL
ncbi:MAG: ribosomal protein S18-alanine N-acetyltransferase [Porticoccus sp.]|nr:ribosomal protein S18-alanine N-acetyltransferase [Porticoccus sp.]